MPDIKMVAMGCKPDPYKFTIIKCKQFLGCTIIIAKYEGCVTFRGEKLMLLKGLYEADDFVTLDPHFLDEDYAVIGRFAPTELGWKMAMVSAAVYNDEQ